MCVCFGFSHTPWLDLIGLALHAQDFSDSLIGPTGGCPRRRGVGSARPGGLSRPVQPSQMPLPAVDGVSFADWRRECALTRCVSICPVPPPLEAPAKRGICPCLILSSLSLSPPRPGRGPRTLPPADLYAWGSLRGELRPFFSLFDKMLSVR